jgi:hypothetical protein
MLSYAVGKVPVIVPLFCSFVEPIQPAVFLPQVIVGVLSKQRVVEVPEQANAKFQFTLCHPDDTVFSSDFNEAIANVRNLQAAIAGTKVHRHLLAGEAKLPNVKLSSKHWLVPLS